MFISMMHSKGGVGKSTLAVNLACYFHLQGQSVLIIDADPQGTIDHWNAVDDEIDKPVVKSIKPNTPKLSDKLNGLIDKDFFDKIIMDCPGSAQDITIEAMRVSDVCIMPVGQGVQDVWPSESFIKLADMVYKDGKPKMQFVMNNVRQTIMAAEIKSYLKQVSLTHESCGVFNSTVPQLVRYGESFSRGGSVHHFRKEPEFIKPSIYIKRLANEIEELNNE